MTMTTSQLHPRLGLSAEEAARRLAIDGANEIARARPVSRLALFGRQFTSPVIWLLLVASAISLAVGEVLDATVISVIVLLNSMIGFFQEQRAEGAVSALREMTAPRARVVREGRGVMVTAREVVVGDVLVLEAGDIVAADAKLLSAHMLTAMEAALTGESAPVDKSVQPSGPDAPLAERTDCVFMGTAISTGSGISEVTGTGMGTELGRIASLLNSTTETTTPLQRRLAQVSVSLLWVCSALVVLVAVAGILRGWPLLQVFMTAVSLAVAAVPEGLPAVVTIALAVGVQRMATQKVLVRRLPAVETLG